MMRSPSSFDPISLTYSSPQICYFKWSRRQFCIFWTILPCRLFNELPSLCTLKTEGTHFEVPARWPLVVQTLLWLPGWCLWEMLSWWQPSPYLLIYLEQKLFGKMKWKCQTYAGFHEAFSYLPEIRDFKLKRVLTFAMTGNCLIIF